MVFLLSLAHRDAIDEDASQPDSLARCTVDGPGAPTTHAEWDPLLAIAEWNDVHAAKARVLAGQRRLEAELVLELRSRGHTEREVAELVRGSAAGVHRTFNGLIGLILEELGGEAEPLAPARSQVEACLRCGTRPRVRLRARHRHGGRGRGKIEIRPERQAALCEECLPVERRSEIVTSRSWREAA